MNVSKSLKVKNRLTGELAKLQEVAYRENSRRNDNLSKVDVAGVFAEIASTRNKLVNLKAAIVQASAPIAESLARLTELKGHINWLSGLRVREGEEKVSYGDQVETYTWTAYLNRERLDEQIGLTQMATEALQDEIDEFNAKTQVNWEQ